MKITIDKNRNVSVTVDLSSLMAMPDDVKQDLKKLENLMREVENVVEKLETYV